MCKTVLNTCHLCQSLLFFMYFQLLWKKRFNAKSFLLFCCLQCGKFGQIGTSLYIALHLLAKRLLFILKNDSREWLLDIKQYESCNATLDFCLALVSKSSFTYYDSTGSVFCISTELFCTSSLQHACCMPMWKHCYKYNSTVGTVVVLCVCGWGRVCLCWLVRSSSCTCRSWPSYWTVALF